MMIDNQKIDGEKMAEKIWSTRNFRGIDNSREFYLSFLYQEYQENTWYKILKATLSLPKTKQLYFNQRKI